MKKMIMITSLLFSISSTATVFAEGCASLVNTKWTGQAKIIGGKNEPIQVIINSADENGMFYELTGTINNEPLTARVGCMEKPGIKKISSVNFENNHTSIGSVKFEPDASNPIKILALSGKIKGKMIDSTSNPSGNYLVKG